MTGVSRRSHQGALLLAALLANTPARALDANALPTGGTVSAGSAAISTSGNSMTVTQSSQNVAINWPSYNIGSNASVTYIQPNASAIALNRVLGTDGTQILGSLKANGQVWILNPNGVLFGKGALVDVGGLVASTLNLSDADFLAGRRSFSGSGGNVLNQGEIHAGYVALLGEQVANEGVIVANLGTVTLAAGNQVTLDFSGDRLLNVQVDEGALKALADNKGLIQADGGTIVMTAKAKDALLDTAVNNSGILQARAIANTDGVIKLLGDMDSGTANIGGTLDATGGFVETSAHSVKVQQGTTVRAGHWLIDPTDITIDSALASTLQGQLGSGNATVQTQSTGSDNGDILVNSGISWSANTLTLNAHRNIVINAPLNGSGTAGLALLYGQSSLNGDGSSYQINAAVNLASTGSFSTKQGSYTDTDPIVYTIIDTLSGLQDIANALGGKYVLGSDIAAGATAGWNGGAGFVPIGADGNYPFLGRFEGLGHTISNLTINRPAQNNVGLFGWTKEAVIQNLTLADANITGKSNVGALAGVVASNDGFSTVDRVFVSGGSVSGESSVGGLVGTLSGWAGNTTLSHSASTADVAGSGDYVGGLAGYVYSAGGHAVISESYAAGNIAGVNSVGGLVGTLDGDGADSRIENSYAIAAVTGSAFVGGLVGYSTGAGPIISYSYAAGPVTGVNINTYGGLVGFNEGTIVNSLWNAEATGQTEGVGANLGAWGYLPGQTSAQMKTLATFTNAGWNSIDAANGTGSVWRIYEGQSYPVLRALQKTLTVSAKDATKTYDGNAWNGENYDAGSNAIYSQAGAPLSGKLSFSGAAQDAVNAGTYAITPGGLEINHVDQQSWQDWADIAFVNGTLTVAKANATVTANSASVTYNGAMQSVSGFTTSGLVNGETAAVLTGLVDSGGVGTNAGTYAHNIAVGSYEGNYNLSFTPGALTIAALPSAGGSSDTSTTNVVRTPTQMAMTSAPYAAALTSIRVAPVEPARGPSTSTGAPVTGAPAVAGPSSVMGLPGLAISEDF